MESAQHLKAFLSCCFTHKMTLRIHLLALRMIDSLSARKYFYFTQYDTRFETGTLSTELCLVLYLMAHVSSPYC